jgi:hypothetical protein
MPTFEIETYKVSSQLRRRNDAPRFERVLELVGPVLFHGIQNRAVFAFDTAFDGTWANPVVGYLRDGGDGQSLVGWFPVREFSTYYDLVRSERPVFVTYGLQDSGARSGYLSAVGLGTSTEEIGEGPSESTDEIQNLLAERLAPTRRRVVPLPTRKDVVLDG